MNHSFLDAMSLVHVGVGMGFGLFRVRWWLTLLVAVLWEVAEHVLKIHRPQMFMFPSQDSLANAIGDVLCTGVGWALAGPISRASGRRRGRRTAP
jgi:predicted cobalt transporter CbtA